MRVLIVFLLLCGSAWADWQPADMDFLETEYGYVPYPNMMVESGDSFYMVDNPKLVNRDNVWQYARRVRIRNIDVPHHGFDSRNHPVDLTCIYAIDRAIEASQFLKNIFRENSISKQKRNRLYKITRISFLLLGCKTQKKSLLEK